MSGEQDLRELVAELVVSLAHMHRRLDDISEQQDELTERVAELSRKVEVLRDDVSLIKREILPAQPLRLDEFSRQRAESPEPVGGEP